MQPSAGLDLSDDHDVFNGDTEMSDAVLDDATRMNLTRRFDESVSPENNPPITIDQNAPTHVNQSPQPASRQSMMAETTLTSTDPQPAPQDPRNNINTGSAGAALR